MSTAIGADVGRQVASVCLAMQYVKTHPVSLTLHHWKGGACRRHVTINNRNYRQISVSDVGVDKEGKRVRSISGFRVVQSPTVSVLVGLRIISLAYCKGKACKCFSAAANDEWDFMKRK